MNKESITYSGSINYSPTRQVEYNMEGELTDKEKQKILRLAREVKRGKKKVLLIEMAYGKKDELYIVGLNP